MRGTLALDRGWCRVADVPLGSRAGTVRAALLSAHASVSSSEVGLMTRRVSKQRVEDGSHADNAGEMTSLPDPFWIHGQRRDFPSTPGARLPARFAMRCRIFPTGPQTAQ